MSRGTRHSSLAFDGFEVPGLHRFVGERLEVCEKPVTKVIPIVDAMARKMSEPLKRVLPMHDMQVLRCPDSLGCHGLDN